MALLKEIQTRSGITVSYWKITDWKLNQSAKCVDMILTPYVSSELRTDGYEPIRDEVRKIRATDYFIRDGHELNRTNYTDYFSPIALENAAAEGKSIYNVMYDFIKNNNEEFIGAKNV